MLKQKRTHLLSSSDENMHGRKLTLNEVDKEKINYYFNFNCAWVYEKVFMYHNFPDTEVVIL